jgi:hypothetical protein
MSRKRKADDVVDSVRADASDDYVLDDMNGRRIAENLPETVDDAYDANYVDDESCPDGESCRRSRRRRPRRCSHQAI